MRKHLIQRLYKIASTSGDIMATNADVATLRELRNNTNVQNMLNIIARSEGTNKYPNGGYNTIFGGEQVEDLSKHPKIYKDYTDLSGTKIKTSAAGRYQIVGVTNDGLNKSLNLPDFSPESQDIMAIELIRRRGALDDVLKGDYKSAINKLGSEWASLPSSKYAQPKRTMGEILGGSDDFNVPMVPVIQNGRRALAVPTDVEEATALEEVLRNNMGLEANSVFANAIGMVGDARRRLDEQSDTQLMPNFLDEQILNIIDRV